MVTHVVLFRLRSDLTRADREGLVWALDVALRSIPSIHDFRIGKRVTFGAGYEQGAPSLDLCALIQFHDFSGLKAYLAHFAHQDIAGRFTASIEEALVYDYEMMGPEGASVLLEEG
jgi:Stress responsive A/B Barrel Domain